MIDRTKFLGASDSPAIMGYSKWKDSVSLWKEKTGLVEPENLDNNEYVIRGKEWEPLLLKMFSLDNPELKVRGPSFHTMSENPYMCATLDGSVQIGVGEIYPIEIKTVSNRAKGDWYFNKKTGLYEIPKTYLIQVHHQMLVTNSKGAYLYARFFNDYGSLKGGKEIQLFIERNDVLCQKIQKECQVFWNQVQLKLKPQRKWVL